MTKPYWSDDAVTLYCGDFRELLPEVVAKHGEPDLTLTDPPYEETSLKWDRWPDGWPSLIPGNSMWCFGSMRMFMDRRDDFSGWRMSQDVVWRKNSGTGAASDRFRRVHEHAVHWYRGPWAEVTHIPPRVPSRWPHRSQQSFKGAVSHWATPGNGSTWVDDGTRLAESVVDAPNMFRKSINTTEKPAALVERLLTYGCPPGGLVLDVFAGSCSTLVAARNLGRRAVGIELRPEQCEQAVKFRLSQSSLPFGEAS